MSNDAIQRVSEAAAAIIDTAAAVTAITGRPTGNITRWRRRARITAAPALAYLCTDADERVGVGENWDVALVLRVFADTAAQANALLRAAIEALTPQAFEAAGADAVVMTTAISNLPEPDDPAPTSAAVVEAEAELTIWITL